MAVIKLYDLLESIIQETGENTAEPYTATRVSVFDEYGHVKYTWETENNVSYQMYIGKEFTYETDDCVYEISFGIIDPETEKVDTTVTSKSGNVGNMRRVMATVIKYVKEELARDTKEGWQVSHITMSPTKETNFDDRRANLYLAYIKKNMPAGARVDYNDAVNQIIIYLPVANTSSINEVGENTAKPYPIIPIKRLYGYTYSKFNTEEDVEYAIYIDKDRDSDGNDTTISYTVDFGIQYGDDSSTDYSSTSKNRKTGNLQKIIATVIKAIEEEIKLDNAEPNTKVVQVQLQPTDERRSKLYMAYVQKNKPANSTVTYQDNTITIDF